LIEQERKAKILAKKRGKTQTANAAPASVIVNSVESMEFHNVMEHSDNQNRNVLLTEEEVTDENVRVNEIRQTMITPRAQN